MKSVMKHQFSQAPTADIPRSSFNRSFGHKTTIDAGKIYPIFVDEAMPGDTFTVNPSMFARLNTPIYPIMDNMYLDVHFFSVPIRQIWTNFRKFCGEQEDPGDSTDYTIPTLPNVGGVGEGSLHDYMGVPPLVTNLPFSALPMRAYGHVYNEWYRDQNLIDSVVVDTGDAHITNIPIQTRGKRHDYFTSCLPWLQKGDAVTLPLGDSAPIMGVGAQTQVYAGPGNAYETDGTGAQSWNLAAAVVQEDPNNLGFPNARADLSAATAATINELRQAFQIQKLLERDARSGTRYSEIVNAHFGVKFLDVTYRPEFLGGESVPINIHTVPQTSESGLTPQGTLSGFGTVSLKGGGFTKSFTEHCIVLGLVSVRTDLTYQQGLNRMYSRETRYDMYWPALAHIGEQAVLNKEIYADGSAADTAVFGYQERWAEYRYKPSMLTGKMRSSATGTLDAWHLSQEFGTLPQLNQTFIEENPPMSRVTAVPTEPDFLLDTYFDMQCARPMPLYSVPGLIDHF